MKMFSVHDSKAEAYLSPIYFKSAGEALRAFETSCKDENTQFNKYPSDFTLVELGIFDELTAQITAHTQPRIISNAAEFTLRKPLNPYLTE